MSKALEKRRDQGWGLTCLPELTQAPRYRLSRAGDFTAFVARPLTCCSCHEHAEAGEICSRGPVAVAGRAQFAERQPSAGQAWETTPFGEPDLAAVGRSSPWEAIATSYDGVALRGQV